MWGKWMTIAALALMALAAEGMARPTDEDCLLRETRTNYIHEYNVSSCPHTIRRIASPQQTSGVWYPWEMLIQGTLLKMEFCPRHVFSFEGDRLTVRLEYLVAGVMNRSIEFTYAENPPTFWESTGLRTTNGFQMGFASDDENILVMCRSSIVVSRDQASPVLELSLVLGRQPTLNETAISVAVNQTALEAARRIQEVVSIRPPLGDCSAPAAAAATHGPSAA